MPGIYWAIAIREVQRMINALNRARFDRFIKYAVSILSKYSIGIYYKKIRLVKLTEPVLLPNQNGKNPNSIDEGKICLRLKEEVAVQSAWKAYWKEIVAT
jgi:hypothetical protein